MSLSPWYAWLVGYRGKADVVWRHDRTPVPVGLPGPSGAAELRSRLPLATGQSRECEERRTTRLISSCMIIDDQACCQSGETAGPCVNQRRALCALGRWRKRRPLLATTSSRSRPALPNRRRKRPPLNVLSASDFRSILAT
ncbi:hypothetical protein AAFF_G00054220 [Aldrovandia affinis]|uniref:Uncharacterized protein n=1 Tax=Aldrovandia affinis TaxID=143900 RepID=A0AAD7WEQ7_9TELE|nr:hypothetical protein AAFF_G00054220 [Aldrovandia affinis]